MAFNWPTIAKIGVAIVAAGATALLDAKQEQMDKEEDKKAKELEAPKSEE